MKNYYNKSYGGLELQHNAFFTSALDGSDWLASNSGGFIPGKEVFLTHGIRRQRATHRRFGCFGYDKCILLLKKYISKKKTDFEIRSYRPQIKV
jgi:hypothetical protein